MFGKKKDKVIEIKEVKKEDKIFDTVIVSHRLKKKIFPEKTVIYDISISDGGVFISRCDDDNDNDDYNDIDDTAFIPLHNINWITYNRSADEWLLEEVLDKGIQ